MLEAANYCVLTGEARKCLALAIDSGIAKAATAFDTSERSVVCEAAAVTLQLGHRAPACAEPDFVKEFVSALHARLSEHDPDWMRRIWLDEATSEED